MFCPEAIALILIATAPFAGRRVIQIGNGACFLIEIHLQAESLITKARWKNATG
jgi:hypothetical protein